MAHTHSPSRRLGRRQVTLLLTAAAMLAAGCSSAAGTGSDGATLTDSSVCAASDPSCKRVGIDFDRGEIGRAHV